MTFQEALVRVKNGFAVKRDHWINECLYVVENWKTDSVETTGLKPMKFIALKTADNFLVPWPGTMADYLASDWIVAV